MSKFVDTNIFLERWNNPQAKAFIDAAEPEESATSVVVLAEVYHHLQRKNAENAFDYIRDIMGKIAVYDLTNDDLFNACKSLLKININDKLVLATMKRVGIKTIVSHDKDFDSDTTIIRETI